MALGTLTMNIKTDTSVIQPLYDKLEAAICGLPKDKKQIINQAFESLLNNGQLLDEVSTVEPDGTPKGSKQLIITFYPTERFLAFARAVFNRDFDSLGNQG